MTSQRFVWVTNHREQQQHEFDDQDLPGCPRAHQRNDQWHMHVPLYAGETIGRRQALRALAPGRWPHDERLIERMVQRYGRMAQRREDDDGDDG